MRIVFMGTPDFAVGSLQALVNEGFNIVGIVTTPDKPAGRGLKIHESAVKQYAKQLNIPILQPEKLKDADFIEQLKNLKADVQVVVAFRMLPELVWAMPSIGTINLHASILPQYRGAAPINWAIINGEKETGVTTFFIEKEIDTGKIIFNEKVAINESMTAGQLHDLLMVTGGKLLVKTLKAIESGNYPQVSQSDIIKHDETLKPAPKIFKEDCLICWDNDISEIYNHIRGLSPYPASWAVLKSVDSGSNITFKIFDATKEIENHQYKTGEILTDNKSYMKIAVNGGFINILSLQLEGKKRLQIAEFLRGFKVTDYKLELK